VKKNRNHRRVDALAADRQGDHGVRRGRAQRPGAVGLARRAPQGARVHPHRRLENNFDKEHILWLYLNEVYLGHHSYGVQAAAENYFRKNVWELSLPEMALIAGLPQAPSQFSPFAHPERAKARRAYVLRRMFEEGMITAQGAEGGGRRPHQGVRGAGHLRETSPYVTEHIRRDLVGAVRATSGCSTTVSRCNATVDLEREHDAIAATIKGVIEADKRQGFRGPLMNLKKKDWDDFTKKEQAFLEGRGQAREVIAALVTLVEKESPRSASATRKAQVPLEQAAWRASRTRS